MNVFFYSRKKKMSVIFYDFETTSLDVRNNKIIQFAFLHHSTNEIFHSFVNPSCPIPPVVSEITNITNETVSGYETFDFYLPSILQFIETFDKPVYFIAHNGNCFDKLIFCRELKQNKIDIPTNWKFIDSLSLARYFFPEFTSHSLDSLRKQFSIKNDQSHYATQDVYDLQTIYNKMDHGDDLELVEKIENDSRGKMNFGKHKGKKFSEINLPYFESLIHYNIISEHKNPEIFDYLKKNL